MDKDYHVDKIDLQNKQLITLPELSQFPSLRRLNLQGNALHDLDTIATSTNLTWLNLSHNNLKKIREIKKLTQLVVLNASNNEIEAVRGLKRMNELGALVLNNNLLTAVPKNLPPSLNTLVLSHNKITEICHLSHLTNLKKLSLACNQIGAISDSLMNNTALTELRIRGNKIARLPPSLENNLHLRFLDIGNNAITDQRGIQVLCKLQKLRNLTIKGNPVASEPGIKDWLRQHIPSLKNLDAELLEKEGKKEKVKKEVENTNKRSLTEIEVKSVKIQQQQRQKRQKLNFYNVKEETKKKGNYHGKDYPTKYRKTTRGKY